MSSGLVVIHHVSSLSSLPPPLPICFSGGRSGGTCPGVDSWSKQRGSAWRQMKLCPSARQFSGLAPWPFSPRTVMMFGGQESRASLISVSLECVSRARMTTGTPGAYAGVSRGCFYLKLPQTPVHALGLTTPRGSPCSLITASLLFSATTPGHWRSSRPLMYGERQDFVRATDNGGTRG